MNEAEVKAFKKKLNPQGNAGDGPRRIWISPRRQGKIFCQKSKKRNFFKVREQMKDMKEVEKISGKLEILKNALGIDSIVEMNQLFQKLDEKKKVIKLRRSSLWEKWYELRF